MIILYSINYFKIIGKRINTLESKAPFQDEFQFTYHKSLRRTAAVKLENRVYVLNFKPSHSMLKTI